MLCYKWIKTLPFKCVQVDLFSAECVRWHCPGSFWQCTPVAEWLRVCAVPAFGRNLCSRRSNVSRRSARVRSAFVPCHRPVGEVENRALPPRMVGECVGDEGSELTRASEEMGRSKWMKPNSGHATVRVATFSLCSRRLWLKLSSETRNDVCTLHMYVTCTTLPRSNPEYIPHHRCLCCD